MRTPMRMLPLLVAAPLAGCGEDPQLKLGRQVWEGTCQACHQQGLAGAPRIGDNAAWQPRIAQGLEVLTRHAIDGFSGRGGDQMPARGGNAALSDEQVAAAVAYMVSNSQ